MKTLFLAAADAVVVLHLLWIVFLILGAIPGRRRPWIKWTHLGSLGFSIALQAFGWICPLTHVEIWLRRTGGAQTYEGTFIRHYVESLVYIAMPRGLLFAGTLIVVGVSLWIYFGSRPRL